MEKIEKLKSITEKNYVECKIQATAYSIWLDTLVPANLILVVGAALLSLIAGASMLVEQGIISRTMAVISALISSGFTLIHNKLNCDHHQAECRRLLGLYKGLSEDYKNLEVEFELATEEDIKSLKLKLDKLNAERTQVIKGGEPRISQKSIDKARKLVNNEHRNS